MEKLKIVNRSWAVGRGYGCIMNVDGTYLKGVVFTKKGIVTVYSQCDRKNASMSRMDMVVNGRTYSRRFNRRYSKRGLVTKAKEFSSEVI